MKEGSKRRKKEIIKEIMIRNVVQAMKGPYGFRGDIKIPHSRMTKTCW